MIYYAIIVSSALIILTGCQSTKSAYPDTPAHEVQQERQIQKALAAEETLYKQEKKEIRKLKMEQRLLLVGQRIRKGGMKLCKALRGKDVKSCVYTFELTEENKQLNAYADGEKIYVTPSMMRFAKTDDELAVVLGHEFAHNAMDHITSKKTNMVFGNILGAAADLLASSQGVSTGGAFANLGTNMGALSYSQSFEREADYVGLYVTALSGYKIKPAPLFWRRMSLKNTNAIEESSTHPTTPERFVMLKKSIKEIKQKQQRNQTLLPELKKADS